MKNSQRLLDSIGRLDDSLIENAVSYEPAAKIKASSARPVKRVAAVAVAAVMCVALAVTCFANAEGIQEAIKSIFSREEELIDPYAAMIDESTEAEGISVTVDKIAKDGDNYIIYVHLRNPAGFEPGYLYYDQIEIEQQTSKGWKTRYSLAGVGIKDPETALLAGTSWTKVESKTQDLDLLIKVDAASPHFDNMYADSKTNDFRLSIYELATIQIVEENGGYPKCFDPYFDKLSVDFEFDESKVEPLPEKVSYPNVDFEIDGTTFRLTEIRYSPMHLVFAVEDPNCEIIEVDGLHFYGTSKLNWQLFCEEYPPTQPMSFEESQKLREFVREHNLLYGSYNPAVETSVEDKQWSYNVWYDTEDGEYNVNKLVYTWKFSKPMYEEDIKSISFEAYIYDEYPITSDTGYTIDKIVAWTNPEIIE